MRRQRPEACRISSVCCCRAIWASTWCTSRTRAPAAYINDLIGGQVPAAIDTVADLSELHRAGRIRILATTGATRAPATPDVPTFSELGLKNVVASGWFGFFAPASTPKAVDRHAESRDQQGAGRRPDVVERLTKLGMDPVTSTPEEFARIVAFGLRQMGTDREGVRLHRRLELLHLLGAPWSGGIPASRGSAARASGLHTPGARRPAPRYLDTVLRRTKGLGPGVPSVMS